MSDTNSIRKPSGLKPPSKVARPTNIFPEKESDHISAADVSSLPQKKGNGQEAQDDSKIEPGSELTASNKKLDTTGVLAENIDDFIIGDRVWVGGTKPGAIAFIGETQFGPGDWAGVVLDEPIGKNDGSVAGIRYFQCAANKGIFTRLSRLSRYPMEAPGSSNLSRLCSTPVTPERKNSFSNMSIASSVVSRLKTPSVVGSIFGGSSNYDVKVGDRVIVQSSHGSKVGVLKFYGTTEFGNGIWCGVELSDPLGKNDGSVAGVRYFECAPKHGLFVPAEKVSRSPMSKKYNPGNMTRQGTLESMKSTSTILTSATSHMKTYKKPTTPGSKPSSSRPLVTSTPKASVQDQLIKDKDTYIAQLLKEQELERLQITKAATQAEEFEKELSELKKEYNAALINHEIQSENLQKTIEKLEKEKNDLNQQLEESRKRLEDLQFNYEEESITKSEIQAMNEEYVEKLKNLEKFVNSQHASLEYDGQSSGLFSSMVGISESILDDKTITDTPVTDELSEAKQILAVLNDRNSELENECREMRENLEKLKLIDSGKEEVITTLRNEITKCQQLSINETSTTQSALALQTELETLKTELDKLEKMNETMKQSLDDANNKIINYDSDIRQKDETLSDLKASLEIKGKEAFVEFENLKNQFQFEIDESKVKLEEMSTKLEQIQQQLSAKEKESEVLIKCITRLCDEIDHRNSIVNQAILENEENSNVEAAVIQAVNSHRVQTSNVTEDLDICTPTVKDKVQLLIEKIESNTDYDITLLKKLETLNEVIVRKDNLLEELSEKNESLRKEFHESIEDRTVDLKKLENRNIELEKIKNDLEKQLKKSEDSLKNLEALSANQDEVLQNRLQNIRVELDQKNDEYNALNKHLANITENLERKEQESESERKIFELKREELESEVDSLKEKLSTTFKQTENLQKNYFELFKVNAFIRGVTGKEYDYENLMKPNDDVDELHRETIEKNINVYKGEFEKLKEIIEKLNNENSQKSENIDSLEKLRKKHESENDKLRKESEKLKEELQETISSLDASKNSIHDLEKKCSTLREKLASNSGFEEQLQDLQNEYTNLKETSMTSENEMRTKLKDLENMKTKIEEERNELSDRIDSLSKTNENLTQQLDEREENLSKLKQEVHLLKEACEKNSNLKKELIVVRETKQSLELVNDSLNNELKSINRTIVQKDESAQKKLDEIEKEKRELIETIQKISNESDDLKIHVQKNLVLLQEVEDIKKKLTEKESQITQLQQELILFKETNNKNLILEKELTLAKETCGSLENSVKSVTDELKSVKDELLKSEESSRLLKEKSKKQELELMEKNEKLMNNIEKLKVTELKTQDLTKQIVEMTNMNQNLNDQILEKEKMLSQITYELSSLKESLNKNVLTTQEELSSIRESNNKLKSANETLAKEVSSLKVQLSNSEDLSQKLQTIEIEKLKVEEELRSVLNENSEIKISTEKIRENLEKTVETLKEENSNLTQKLNIEDSKLHCKKLSLETEISSIKETNLILEQSNQSLLDELSKIKEEIGKSDVAALSKLLVFEEEKQKLVEEIDALSHENINLKNKDEIDQKNNQILLEDLQKKLQSAQKKMEIREQNLKNKLSNLEKNFGDLKNEKEHVLIQLNATKKELESLSNNSIKRSVNNSSNDQKVDEKVVDTSVMKNNVNSTDGCSMNEEQLKQIIENKTLAENQVQFLNSVIVDMQRKNETLLERVQFLENIIPPELLKTRKVIAPRLFCDICDEFDLHDTEDCPQQATSSSPPPERRNKKAKPPPRPYCENCEIFGHETSECNDDETF